VAQKVAGQRQKVANVGN